MVSKIVKICWPLWIIFALSLPACSGDHHASITPAARRHNNQGVAYMDQHNYVRGRAEFTRAIELSPDYAIAHTNLGIALFSLGRYDSAAVALERAISLDDSLLQAQYTLGLIITAQGRDYPRALEAMERVCAADPDDPHALYYRGQIKARLGRHLEAVHDFTEAIRLDPYNVSAHYALANQYRLLGRNEERRAALTQFNRLTQAGHRGVSSSYQGQGVYSEAIADVGDTGQRPGDARTPLRFAPTLVLGEGGSTPQDAVAADLNGDRRTDVVLLGTSLAVHTAPVGGEEPLRPETLQLTEPATHITAADWDNDGEVDLLTSGPGVHFIRRDSSGWMPARPLADRGCGAFVGDVDHDGDLELITSTPQGLLLLANDGRGYVVRDQIRPVLPAAEPARAVRFCDLENDRDTDIVAVGDDGIQVFGNNRDGTFTELAAGLGLPAQKSWADLCACDLDEDGYMDLVLLSPQGSVQVWSSHKGRSFVLTQDIPVPLGAAAGLQAADLDLDGDIDLIAWGSDGLFLLRCRAGVLQAPGDTGLLTNGVTRTLPLDWNTDGKPDLLADGQLLLNESETGHWIRIVTRGQGSNRDGLGAKVEIKTTARLQKREVRSPAPLTFGLGAADSVEFVRVLWPSGVRQTELATAADQPLTITELDRKGTSCPIVYAWDGQHFRFVSDINGGAIIGYLVGPREYNRPDTDEYLPLGHLAPLDGNYVIQFANHLEEVIYADALQLVAVDHPAQVKIYPNERLLCHPPYPAFEIYCLEALRPLESVVDAAGRDVTAQLREADDDWYDAFARTDIHGFATDFSLTLDLGDLSRTPTPVLLARGWVDYAHSTSNWAAAQRNWRLEPPRLQVEDGKGGWRTVCADMGTPAGLPKFMLFDLSQVLPAGRTRVRISTNMALYWDQFLIANRIQATTTVHRLPPAEADLHWRGYPEHSAIHGTFAFRYHYDRLRTQASWSTHGGRYTRFGRVDSLLATADDRYVIMFHGDELTLRFPVTALPPLEPGMTRSFLLYSDGFGKDMDLHSAYSLTVEPLPFHNMSTYPYPESEHYPLTPDHLDYLARYNTRVVQGRY